MAIRLNGSSAIYRTANLINLDANYAISFWLYVIARPGAENYSVLWQQNPGAGNSIDSYNILKIDASTAYFNIYTLNGAGGFAESTAATNISLNTWYHIGIIRSANNSRIMYVNGTAHVTHTTSLSGRTASTEMDMGVTIVNPGDYLDGRIAHIKIWQATLTAAQIAAEAYTIRPLEFTGINQWHPTFSGATERLADYSGNGRNWTASGTLSDEDGPPVAWGSPIWVVPVVASTSVALTVADAAHGHTADGVALTQHNALTVAQATHAHAADNVVLSTATALTVAQATHDHTADGVALTQHNALTVAQATHSHAADNLALTQHYSLAVADTAHSHTADGMTLAPHYTLTIDDAGHNGFADSPTLGVGLVVAQATHAHAADNLALTQHNALALAEAAHAHTADGVTLGVLGLLAVADATHGHTTDGVVLTQHNALAVADAAHAHAVDNLALTQHYSLAVADATHAHTADGMTLSALALVVAATIHLHAAGNLALTQHNVLAVADAAHAHTAEQANVGTPAGLVLSANVEIGTYTSVVELRVSLTANVEL